MIENIDDNVLRYHEKIKGEIQDAFERFHDTHDTDNDGGVLHGEDYGRLIADMFFDIYLIVDRFRRKFNYYWPTPNRHASLRYAFTEAGETMSDFLRVARPGDARNNQRSPMITREITQCFIMLITAYGAGLGGVDIEKKTLALGVGETDIFGFARNLVIVKTPSFPDFNIDFFCDAVSDAMIGHNGYDLRFTSAYKIEFAIAALFEYFIHANDGDHALAFAHLQTAVVAELQRTFYKHFAPLEPNPENDDLGFSLPNPTAVYDVWEKWVIEGILKLEIDRGMRVSGWGDNG